jgi:hypothetical protein
MERDTAQVSRGYDVPIIAGLKLLAQKQRGLGIIVVTWAGLIAGTEVEPNGDMEIVFGVEIEPLETRAAGVRLGGLHESVGKTQASKGWSNIETLNLGGVRNTRQRAKHDASGRRAIYRGDPDRGIGTGEVAFKSSAIVSHENVNRVVILLDQCESGIAFLGSGATDSDGVGRIQGFAASKVHGEVPVENAD